MWPDRLARSVAARSLLGSGRLTVLTLVVVGVSVVLVVFLTSLIEGLKVQLVNETTGAIPHIRILPLEKKPIAPSALSTPDRLVIGHRAAWSRERTKIEDWRLWARFARSFDPAITAVSPVAEGPGFASRGAQERPVRIYGVEPSRFNRIVAIEPNLQEGRFLRLGAGECVIGAELAEELGLSLGDRLGVVTSRGGTAGKRVAGIFRTGFGSLDKGAVILSLGEGQSLLGIGSAVTSIGLRVEDVFEAERIATAMQRQVPHEVRDWTRDNERLLGALEAQRRSSQMITFFTAVAAAFAVASILIVLVTNKLPEIGVLRAMGATRRQIRTIFALQGTFLGAAGASLGAVLGVGLVLALGSVEVEQAGTGRVTGLFPFALWPGLVVWTIVFAAILGFLASLIPARRAARVDPIEVIRGG